MTPRSRRFSGDARRLRRRIEKRDAARAAASGDDDDGRAPSPVREPDDARRDDPRADVAQWGESVHEVDERRSIDDGARARGGLISMVFGLFSKKKARVRPDERGDPAPSDDPVRLILAVPRGAARLDAFERALSSLHKGTHGHRAVALAFHRELTSMAREAGVDLRLLVTRVDACAGALVDVGELERAGELFMAAGQKDRAAALFSEAGAIEKLDDASFSMALEGQRGPLDARLMCERVRTLLDVGRRAEALGVLSEAVRRFPRADDVTRLAKSVTARLPPRGRVALAGDAGVVVVDQRWPVVLGRGEATALPLASPLLSREHAELRRDGASIALVSRTPRARLLVDDAPAEGRTLGVAGVLSLDGMAFAYQVGDDALTLSLVDAPEARTLVVPFASRVTLSLPVHVVLTFDGDGRARVDDEGVAVSGERVRGVVPLFVDDVIERRGVRARVVRA